MRGLFVGITIGIALTVSAEALMAHLAGSVGPAYASASRVSAALQQMGAKNDDIPILELKPYIVRAEHRVAPQDPSAPAPIHHGEAELYYVTAGAATLVTGRTPTQTSGGVTLHISSGDVLIIPEDTPHWFSAVNGSISYLSMHMPRSSSPK
jgi:mannose-6-phosphate isomerase-like protein (cupin superfamily)